MDYLAMKHPDIDTSTRLTMVESTIQQWRDAAVKLYIEKSYKPR
jgi:hypothetical protein